MSDTGNWLIYKVGFCSDVLPAIEILDDVTVTF